MHLFLGLSWSGCFLEENQRKNTGGKDVHCFFVITDLHSLGYLVKRLCPELNFSLEPCCISQRARVAETALSLQSCKSNKSSSEIMYLYQPPYGIIGNQKERDNPLPLFSK